MLCGLFCRHEDKKMTCKEWDDKKEEAGLSNQEASIQFGDRPFGPNKYASPRCESGGRNYCTCDTCF